MINNSKTPTIHPAAQIGTVSLTVSDLSSLIKFYRDALGMQVRGQNGSRVLLGSPRRDLLELVENPTAARQRRVTGLYHFALLYPDRRELARAIARLYADSIPNAPTDHIMTKSTYLNDPEGNGIELYCESPDDGAWSLESGSYITRRADGSLSSGREPLDVEALFKHLKPEDRLDIPLPRTVQMGHIHLHVRDLAEAVDFYHQVLGFDRMGQDDSIGMGFVSAGGYHHHIGLNIWQGRGAPAPDENALGLRYFQVELPDQEALNPIRERIQEAGVSMIDQDQGLLVRDPSRNGVLLVNSENRPAATRDTLSVPDSL